ncbi:uncharacterized protein [Rutidosis leptorrhynchoides]|uniref:uncharacterized protein n=1 Tax=Rutidosis leptorrhynchoides TaxID=125765 RepID=UPI003A99CA7D
MQEYFSYFSQGFDAIGRPTFTTLQKCMSAIRQLAYATTPDMWDNYLQMSEQTSILCLDYFCMCIITLYKKEYMRSPNAHDVARLYSAHEERHGFKGMLGSIDCMHWEWRNCPVALKGQYTRGDHKKLTLMLEVFASYDLWIWHAFFGMAGSNNDINVLNQSPIFDKLKNGTFPSAPFEVNGHEYSKRILPCGWMRRAMECCLILHNVILEDNGFALSKWEERFTTEVMENGMERIRNRGRDQDIIAREIRDRDLHNQLTEDLVEHIWNLPPTFRNAN